MALHNMRTPALLVVVVMLLAMDSGATARPQPGRPRRELKAAQQDPVALAPIPPQPVAGAGAAGAPPTAAPAPKPSVDGAKVAGTALGLLTGAAQAAGGAAALALQGTNNTRAQTAAAVLVPLTSATGAAATTLNPQLPATLAPTNPMAAGIRGQPQPAPAGPPSGASVASKVLGGVLMYVQGAKTCVDCQRSCIGTGGEARNYATCAIPTQVIPSCVCMLRALG